MNKKLILLHILIFYLSVSLTYAYDFSFLKENLGEEDSIIITNSKNKVIYEQNITKELIPASTLKVFTSLLALEYLGKDYKFKTGFYLDKGLNLKIKGYGDPLLTSKQVEEIADRISKKVKRVNMIILDDTYYESIVKVNGITDPSIEPYDSPNGSICVNFNTIAFKKKAGKIISAEPETPILPYMIPILENLKYKKKRVLVSNLENGHLMYTGSLFEYFLNKKGVETNGEIILGKVEKYKDKLLLEYESPFAMDDIIKRLLKHSNNFIANQIFLNIGAKLYGEPATLKKSVEAAKIFAKNKLGIKNFKITEGSGISRENKVTAKDMLTILNKFEPYYKLMPDYKETLYYKTGTLNGVQTRVCFLKVEQETYKIVLLINTHKKSADKLLNQIVKAIDGNQETNILTKR